MWLVTFTVFFPEGLVLQPHPLPLLLAIGFTSFPGPLPAGRGVPRVVGESKASTIY